MEAYCENCKVEIDRSERHTLFSGKGCFCSKECVAGYYYYTLKDVEKAKMCGGANPKKPRDGQIVRKNVASATAKDRNVFMRK